MARPDNPPQRAMADKPVEIRSSSSVSVVVSHVITIRIFKVAISHRHTLLDIVAMAAASHQLSESAKEGRTL